MPSESNEQQRIHACMERLAKRYKDAQAAVAYEGYRFASAEERAAINTVRWQLLQWFEDRMEYLQGEYRMSVNRADNIIGKQWLYDQRVRLPKVVEW